MLRWVHPLESCPYWVRARRSGRWIQLGDGTIVTEPIQIANELIATRRHIWFRSSALPVTGNSAAGAAQQPQTLTQQPQAAVTQQPQALTQQVDALTQHPHNAAATGGANAACTGAPSFSGTYLVASHRRRSDASSRRPTLPTASHRLPSRRRNPAATGANAAATDADPAAAGAAAGAASGSCCALGRERQ